MSDAPESQLLPERAQPELLPRSFDGVFDETESHGEFTGERLFQQRPDTYKAVVVLLAQKMGVKRIGGLLGVSPNTVMAVRDREGVSVELVKEHLARVAHAGATLASEAILETLNEVLQRPHCLGVKDLKDLAVVYGILVQNGQLLAGQPTARVEINELKRPEHDDFNAYIRGLPQATVSAVDTLSTHLAEKNSAPKEPGLAAGSAPGAASEPGAASDPSRTDAPSDV